MYRWYVLGLLALTYAFSYMDRQILSILFEDIKSEFLLSDMQLGLLSGLAFAVFYSTLAIPVARFADRANRISILSTALAIWSAMTVLCGTVTNFAQLVLCRIGVGVGEAGATAPAHSVISDYFQPAQRSTVLAVYSLGTAVGALMGLALGGKIAEQFGWRTAFFVAGVPGLALAVLVKISVHEPVRGRLDDPATLVARSAAGSAEIARAPIRSTIAVLWKNAVYRSVTIAHVLAVFVSYAISSWLPALYLRQFDLGQNEVGVTVGLINFLGGVPGLLLGGILANLLGMGFGPLLTGFLSDQLVTGFGTQSLPMAMSVALLVLGGASLWYWRTGVALAGTTENDPNGKLLANTTG